MKCRNVNFMMALHRQADHFCPFGVMPVSQRKKSHVDSYEILWISVHQSLHCSKLLLSPSCYLPPSLLFIPPNLPFTHILLSTSLSYCAMVAQSLLFPAAMKTLKAV